jgi:hypothetical protein
MVIIKPITIQTTYTHAQLTLINNISSELRSVSANAFFVKKLIAMKDIL